jgi:hypothetical protein
MKAIQLTQQLKDLNPDFFEGKNVGDLVKTEIPNIFKTNIDDVITLHMAFKKRTDLHEQVGFIDLVQPADFNPQTHKLLKTFAKVDDVYVYDTEPLSDEEIFNRNYPVQQLSQLQFRTMVEEKFDVIPETELVDIINGIHVTSSFTSKNKRMLIRALLHAEYFEMLDPGIYLVFNVVNNLKQKSYTINDLYQFFQDYA